MASNAVKTIKQDFFNCCICQNRFNVPKLLPCMHNFCQDCLEKYSQTIDSEDLPCPICREVCDLGQTGVEGLQTNFLLVNLGERMDLLEPLCSSPARETCNSCESTDVSFFCNECGSKICHTCKSDHKRFPTLRFHSIIPLNEINQPTYIQGKQNETTSFCQIHPTENVRFYCKTCIKLVCRECKIGRHPEGDHEIVEASCQFQEVKKVLLELLNESSSVCKSNLQFVRTGKSGIKSVEKEFDTLIREITSSYEMTMAAIKNHLSDEMEKMIKEVTGLKRSKRTHIEERIDAASKWLAKMENNQEMTKNVVTQNNMWKILTVSPDLIATFHDLFSEANDLKWHQSDLRQTMIFSVNAVPSVSLGRCSIECDVVLSTDLGSFILITFERSSSTLYVKILRRRNGYRWDKGDHIPPFKISATIPNRANVTATVAMEERSIFIGLGRCLVKFHVDSMTFGKVLKTAKDENVFISSLMWSDFGSENRLCLTHNNDKHIKRLSYENLLSHEDSSYSGRYVNVDNIQNTEICIPEDQSLLKAVFYLDSLACFLKHDSTGYVDSYILSKRDFIPMIDLIHLVGDDFAYRQQLNIFKGKFVSTGGRRSYSCFTCYILWDKLCPTLHPRFQNFAITEYSSESRKIVGMWNVPRGNALPAQCYKDSETGEMVVCDHHGNVSVCLPKNIN